MATPRLTMRNIREILRQKWSLNRSHREVAASLNISIGGVSKIVGKADEAALTWDVVVTLTDDELERVVYGTQKAPSATRATPDFAYLHAERKRPGVTLALLHIEYLEKCPDGYRYTQFCELYRAWLGRRGLTMRLDHRAGDKAFVDYSGVKLHIVDRSTGEVTPVELFVGVLGASNYTFAEASMTQRSADFIGSHLRMLESFGGAPAALVPDQLKSGVARSCWYDPKIQRTYEAMAEHYGTTVMPARPGKPRDKAKVENGVLIVQRWILARVRNEIFYSLDELNCRIDVLQEDLNSRPMKKYGGISRRQLFDRIESTELRPLPTERFEFCEWKQPRVNIDYHVEVDRHYLLGAQHARRRDRRREIHSVDGRAAPPRQAGDVAPPQLRRRQAHDEDGAHAQVAPEARRVDAEPHHHLGDGDGAADGRARRGDHEGAPPSRAGLSLVPGHPAARQDLRHRPARGRLRACHRRPRPLVRPRRVDPQGGPRSRAAARALRNTADTS